MNDLLKWIFTKKQPYLDRAVGRCVGRFIISTAFTTDKGYETAIKDRNGWHPVEHYTNKQGAITGHAKWVEAMPDLKQVTQLGWWRESPTLITLKPLA